MLIPFKNCLVDGMETTFKDLKEKHLKFVAAQWKLREKLQEKAAELIREYVESLALPREVWVDAAGEAHRYVDVGVWSNGKFEPTHLPRLQLDENYSLNFVITTTLDDTPMTGGYSHGISISLRYEGVALYATVGAGDDIAYFQVSSMPGGFFEVCAAIKQLITIAIDRATPTGTPV